MPTGSQQTPLTNSLCTSSFLIRSIVSSSSSTLVRLTCQKSRRPRYARCYPDRLMPSSNRPLTTPSRSHLLVSHRIALLGHIPAVCPTSRFSGLQLSTLTSFDPNTLPPPSLPVSFDSSPNTKTTDASIPHNITTVSSDPLARYRP